MFFLWTAWFQPLESKVGDESRWPSERQPNGDVGARGRRHDSLILCGDLARAAELGIPGPQTTKRRRAPTGDYDASISRSVETVRPGPDHHQVATGYRDRPALR